MKKLKLKNWVFITINLILIGVLIYSAINIINWYKDNKDQGCRLPF